MLLLIILIVIEAVCIFMLAIGKKRDKLGDETYMFWILPVILLVIPITAISVESADISDYESKTFKQYNILEQRVEDKHLGEQTFDVIADLYKSAEYMDNKIARNKRYTGSIWVGGMFSEKVGELKPLTPRFNKLNKNTYYTWENYAN